MSIKRIIRMERAARIRANLRGPKCMVVQYESVQIGDLKQPEPTPSYLFNIGATNTTGGRIWACIGVPIERLALALNLAIEDYPDREIYIEVVQYQPS